MQGIIRLGTVGYLRLIVVMVATTTAVVMLFGLLGPLPGSPEATPAHLTGLSWSSPPESASGDAAPLPAGAWSPEAPLGGSWS